MEVTEEVTEVEEEEEEEDRELSSKCTDSTALTRTNLGTTPARGKYSRAYILLSLLPFFPFFPFFL